MIVSEGFAGREQLIVDVFVAAFTASEGADEGALIGGLVRSILDQTPAPNLRLFTAGENDEIVGAVAFTRLEYPEDRQNVVLLSPMAVAPTRQKQGVGQALLTDALSTLRADGVDVAITYGDPDYYQQVGFSQISEIDAQAPHPLSMPHGWLGQCLDGSDRLCLKGPAICVAAFDRADIW